MPTKERGAISSVTPSGWNNKKYSESVVQGSYIYNRAHLIAHCLGAEDANEKNLITGTRYFNLNMLPFETQVANYIRETNHHVLYRVTPEYEGNNLVASGVQLEARSMEDDEISINVYIYNVQPGITINYSTGENWLDK
jgi:DNA-entry nuclease